jgi:hypothetical protein
MSRVLTVIGGVLAACFALQLLALMVWPLVPMVLAIFGIVLVLRLVNR